LDTFAVALKFELCKGITKNYGRSQKAMMVWLWWQKKLIGVDSANPVTKPKPQKLSMHISILLIACSVMSCPPKLVLQIVLIGPQLTPVQLLITANIESFVKSI
jgi:hypothetical protein